MKAAKSKNTSFRQESDFLGAVTLADHIYYGVQTQRAIDNFPISGRKVHNELIIQILLVKKAAAIANHKTGRLSDRKARAINKAIDRILAQQDKSEWANFFPLDAMEGGAYTSVNMNVNEVIANMALEILGEPKGSYTVIHPNDEVNMSQSTNDVIPTAARLACLELLGKLQTRIGHLAKSFQTKSRDYSGILKLARTHLQDATPVTLGQEMAAYSAWITASLDALKILERNLVNINLGGTAIGTCENASPEYVKLVVKELSKITHQPLKHAPNLIAATQDQRDFLAVSGAVKHLTIGLSKISNDLRFLSSGPRGGIGEINLPALQPGSSIMPGKVNPVIPELVNHTHFLIMGNDLTISWACEAAQLELNVMLPIIIDRLLESLKVVTQVVTMFDEKCVQGLTANESACAANLGRSAALATALSTKIGYEAASKIAKKVAKTGKTIKEVALAEGVSEKEFNKITG